MSIIKHVTLQKIVAQDFRYVSRIKYSTQPVREIVEALSGLRRFDLRLMQPEENTLT